MAQVRIDVEVNAQAAQAQLRTTATEFGNIEKAGKKAQTVFEGVGAAAVEQAAQIAKLTSATDTWSSAQQRAAMRMETMHEEALKMNQGFVATSDDAEEMGRNLSALEGAITSTAGAFGVSASALGPLGSAVDLASVGFDKLKTSSVGFNTASIGVAAAGLAVGHAIGSWLRTFPAVAKAADDAAAALLRLVTSQKDLDAQANGTQGLAKWQADMAKSAEEARARQVATMRAAGAAEAQILDMLKGKHQETTSTVIAGLEKEVEARKRAAAEAEKAGLAEAERRKAMQEAFETAPIAKYARFYTLLPDAIKPATAAVIDFNGAVKTQAQMEAEAAAEAEKLRKALEAAEPAAAKLRGEFLEQMDALDMLADVFDEIGNDVGGQVGGLLRGAADLVHGYAAAGRAALQFAEATTTAGKAMAVMNVAMTAWRGGALQGAAAGATFGSSFGPLGTAIGGAAGALLGFLGAGSRAREEALRLANEIRHMREEFIESHGGIDLLRQRADEAGVSIHAMLNARTVDDFKAAMERLNDAFALQDEAIEKTRAAMERWGLEAADMGPKFAQGMLHEQLLTIFQDFQLLTAAGADAARVLGDPADPDSMAAAMNSLVQQSIAAGVALPESMRPMIARMIELGLLVDENGQAITDVSQLPFTETLEAGVARLVVEIQRLVNALLGIPNEVNTVINVERRELNPGGGGHNAPAHEDLDGDPTTPFAEGGVVYPRPGGTRAILAEANETEFVVPESKADSFARQRLGGGGGVQQITIPVYLAGQKLDEVIMRRTESGFIRL